MNTLTLIPCYNHGKHLPRVVEDVKKLNQNILIVDDGSNDGSSEIIHQIKDINIITHKVNRGKGAALKTGFDYALRNNFDSVITLDADGQHKAYHIQEFVKNAQKYDMIIGTRMENIKNMPKRRIFSNSFSSYLISLKSGQTIHDSQSGYRLYKRNLIESIDLNNNCYQLETEIILKAAKLNGTEKV
ncbi:glycosyltransferase family 2 protein, partial [Patescibacteria group bacterium]|nr:glycosyltransferase family 2 protein [Patescibacteria group bacterium]